MVNLLNEHAQNALNATTILYSTKQGWFPLIKPFIQVKYTPERNIN